MRKIVICILIIITFCDTMALNYAKSVDDVLKKSGQNRIELEKFLKYAAASNDSLKWKAACFLVENMDIHFSDTFFWADSLNQKVTYNDQDYSNYSEAKMQFEKINRIQKLHPVIIRLYDIHQIKADLLIANLERAFLDWRRPASLHLRFDDFCDYLLPYRSLSENLENWYPLYKDSFSLNNKINQYIPISYITKQLAKKIEGRFVNSYAFEAKNNPVDFQSPSQLLFRGRGHCEDMVNLTVLAFRSQGLACRVDMVPYHGTSTGRHYWNVTIGENQQTIPFEGYNPSEEFLIHREPSKVITYSYRKQVAVPGSFVPESEIPANFLRCRNIVDVTSDYWRTKDISCTLFNCMNKSLAYVAVFNGLQWCAAYWGKIETDNKVTFPKMGCGVAYLPMLFDKGKLTPAAYPILLYSNKEEKELKPDIINCSTILLGEQEKYLKYRVGKRYSLYYWDKNWVLIAEKIAGDKPELSFDGVPHNALLLLLPEYSKGKERPFTISEQGERIWW